jgi:peptide/nickel transport system substrate-binding protein
VLWRVRATFRDAFALDAFPFDRHVLRIEVEHPTLGAEALVLRPDAEGFGIAPGVGLPGFSIGRRRTARERRVAHPTRLGRIGGPGAEAESRSRVSFEVELARHAAPWALRLFLPLALALALAGAVFAIDGGAGAARIAVAAAAVLAALLAHATQGDALPRPGYVVTADAYLAIAHGAALAALGGAVGLDLVARSGREGLAAALARGLGFGLPLAALGIGAIVTARRGRRAAAEPPAEPPRLAPRSTRPELAVGLLHEPTRLVEGCVTTADQFVSRFLVEQPVEHDNRLNLVARLAAGLPSFENGRMRILEDGRHEVRWRLKAGLRWGDGTPIVPEDALAAHRLRPIPQLSARGEGLRIENGEIVVEYEGPRVAALVDLRLFPRARVDELASEDGRRRFGTAAIPPLAGPFRIEAWHAGEEIVLSQNPYYAGGKVALERVRVRIFKTREDLSRAFAAREIQLVPEGVLEPAEAEALARRTEGAEARRSTAPNWYRLDVNHDDPLLADRRVRQALLFAIDREAMIRTVLGGYGKVAHTWLHPQHEGYSARTKRYPFDPARAAALLDEAGYRAGPDGKRRGPGGKPLELEIVRAERHPAAAIEFLAGAAWGPLGIAVRPRVYPEQTYFREVLGRRQWKQLAFYGYVFDPWETGRESWCHDRIPREENGWKGKNWAGWRNEAATALHLRIEATFNEDERADLFERQQAIWAEELPCLPLYRTEQALLVGAGLRGVVSHAGGDYALPWNAEDWHFVE